MFGLFPEMDNGKEDSNAQVIIQSYDPNNMDPQELATLIEQTGGASDEGCVQIVDGDGNLITITAAQLASAGIDLANINESDVETLLQLANQNDPSSSNVHNSPTVNASVESPSITNNDSPATSTSNHRKRGAVDDGYADSSACKYDRELSSNDDNNCAPQVAFVTGIYSLACENSALEVNLFMAKNKKNLVDDINSDIFFIQAAKISKLDNSVDTNGVETSDILSGQLSLNGSLGEITELDPETLASLMQNGAVKFVDEQGNEIPASAILSSASGDQSVIIEDQAVSDAPNLEMMSGNEGDSLTVPTSISPPKTVHNIAMKNGDNDVRMMRKHETENQMSTGYALIGALVDVKRAQGNTERAIVRYVRPGVGYKVQFQDDNHFEWVNESQIIPRPLGEEVDDDVSAANDVTAIKSQPLNDFSSVENTKSTMSNVSSSSSGRLSTAVTTYAGRRSNSSSSSQQKIITSPTPKNCATFTAASSAAVAAAKKSMCAAAHDAVASSAAASEEGGSHATTATTENTNFVCPVCEKKIYNKQPAYIVIRLPACDSCAESKILVLDDAKRA
uniref:Uncharacterized protein n=1 Tax=Romanomermis culicivorax TaxID=13658 RepID=A0A915HYV6_ROMCU